MAIQARLRALRPDARARWGRWTAPQLIAHLADELRIALGDAAASPRARFPLFGLIVLVFWLPWPRKPDVDAGSPQSWSADLARLEDLIDRFGARDPRGSWPRHYFFGR